MKTEIKNLADLMPAEYNPRKDLTPEDGQYRKIRRSLQEFGLVEPLIWNRRTGRLVSGHQRLKVLLELGETQSEVVVIDISQKEEKKLNVLLNRARGRWHDEKLAALIHELDEIGAVELTGFDDWELQGLLESYNQLDDILAYSPLEPEEDDQQSDSDPDTFSMTFSVPAEYQEMIERYLNSVEDAELLIANAVINMVKEAV